MGPRPRANSPGVSAVTFRRRIGPFGRWPQERQSRRHRGRSGAGAGRVNDPPWPGCESVTPAARGGHYYAEMRASLSGARPFGSLSHLDRFIISLDLYNFILKLIKIFKFHKNKIYIKKILKRKFQKNYLVNMFF